MSVVAAVLAAGASRRLGRAKQALEVDGVALLTRTVEAALASRASRVVVILGYDADRLRPLVPQPAEVVVNDDWREGMASTIRAAVDAARGGREPADAILFAVCDQPALDAAVLDRLIETWRRHRPWASAARYAGCLGVPAIFDRSSFDALARLRGDRGARDLLRGDPARVSAVDWPEGARDVDENGDLPEKPAPPRTDPS